MNLPDFICIGGQKCGTKWLQQVVSESPHFWVPPIKELGFFNHVDERAHSEGGVAARNIRYAIKAEWKKGYSANDDYLVYLQKNAEYSQKSIDWYNYIFSWPCPSRVRKGDISPAYLELSDTQTKHARAVLGEKKIIVLVRSPLERELSQFRMWIERAMNAGRPPTNLRAYLRIFHDMVARKPHGNYRSGIDNWTRHFGEDNIRAFAFGDIRDNPEKLIADIEDFVGAARWKKYRLLRTPVHPTAKIEIPEEVIALAREKTASQVDYLIKKFGDDFFARTR